MKRIVIAVIFGVVLSSCASNMERVPYNFDNFKDTPLWDLAQAVRSDDANEINAILKSNKPDIDYKDPKFQQTLLALSIQNKKRTAFLELLKAGANPNELLGNPKDATPFMYGVENVENCDLYYVETMLKYKANANLAIKNPIAGHYFAKSFPLLVAIGINDNEGNECVDLVKLLVDNGADMNYCFENTMEGICEGVIKECLLTHSMKNLRYFVVEKKINVPDSVYIIGGIDKATQKVYSLSEILKTKEYDFAADDLAEYRKAKEDVLEYLQKNKMK